MVGNNKCQCDCKSRHECEKDYAKNPATCSCENGKYLATIMDDSAITFDQIIDWNDEETKATPTNVNEKKATCKTCKISMFYLHFY